MEDKKHQMPDKETFLAELRKAEDPEQMSWLMANYLMDKVHHKMRDAMPEPDEDQSYGHTWDSRYSHAMTGTGHSMRRGRSGSSLEEYKERLGEMLGQSMTEDDIKCLICKEAASIIKRICKDEPFEAFKEFAELCIGMKAYAEQYPEDLEEQAKEEAIGKYVEMFQKYGHRSRAMRSMPVYRIRADDMDEWDRKGTRRHELPLVSIDDFSYRSRSRDKMGRFK
jgi:hypothetical protein